MNPKNSTTHLELLISDHAIHERIKEVCAQLDQDYADQEITVVMIMKGALCLVADLIRLIHLPCSIEVIQSSSYGERGVVRGGLTLSGIEKLTLQEKHVLLVDDIFDSGITLSTIAALLEEKSPKSLKSLVLLSKNVPHKTTYRPDYVLFEIEDRFVVGYGLDYKEYYRGLPGIYALSLENFPNKM